MTHLPCTSRQDQCVWQPMATAPKDGKHCILAILTGTFVYSIQGAFMDGKWLNAANIEAEPLCWMPSIRVPREFLPWTAEFEEIASLKKLDWDCLNESRSSLGDLYSVSRLSEIVCVTYKNGSAFPGWKSSIADAKAVAQSDYERVLASHEDPANAL